MDLDFGSGSRSGKPSSASRFLPCDRNSPTQGFPAIDNGPERRPVELQLRLRPLFLLLRRRVPLRGGAQQCGARRKARGGTRRGTFDRELGRAWS
jgi:hypothetical protein